LKSNFCRKVIKGKARKNQGLRAFLRSPTRACDANKCYYAQKYINSEKVLEKTLRKCYIGKRVNLGTLVGCRGAPMDANVEYQKLKQELREKILHFYYIGAIVIFLTECLYYPFARLTGLGEMRVNLSKYVGMYILAPSMTVLLCVWLTGRAVHSHLSDERKDKALLYCIWVICEVTAVVHSYFLPIVAVFITPIILSVLFDDAKLVKWTTVISFLLMFVSVLLAPLFDNTWSLTDRLVSLVPLMACMTIASFICITLLYSSARKNAIISREVKQRKEMQHALCTDAMTGLYNHSEFYNVLEKYQQKNKHLTVAVMDVDYFKQVNDVYGHECGDRVLIEVAKELQEICGEEGHVSRYGGEEFSVIYEDKSEQEVITILERARTRIHSKKFDFMNGESIGISCGVYEYTGGEMTPQKIFSMADRAMYQAKRNGRNQCVGYTEYFE